ncbi:MAG: glycosyltransferase family 2 protein [Gaiellaceae bacterium]
MDAGGGTIALAPRTLTPTRALPTALRRPNELFAGYRPRLRYLVLIYAVVLGVQLYLYSPADEPLNAYVTVMWSIYFPIVVVGLMGLDRRKKQPVVTQYGGVADDLVIFFLPTIGRTDTLPALCRVVDSILRYAPQSLTHFRVDIVTEEGAEARSAIEYRYGRHECVRVLAIPRDYATPNGTRFKARANQYALEERRGQGEARDDVFVYHLDDDTAVGVDTVASLAEFINCDADKYDLAQGILAFPHQLSPSFFCRMADSARPFDDMTRFRLFTGVLGRPLMGLHGEHLVIRSSVEDEIGWDFGRTKVEDAHFALLFSRRYPGRSTMLRSYTYGASPARVGDLITQRRRWAAGLIALVLDRQIPLRDRWPLMWAVANWVAGIFYTMTLVWAVALLTGHSSTSPMVEWVLPIWALNFAFALWGYLEGLKINWSVSERTVSYPKLVVMLLPTFPIVALIEAYATLLGLRDAVLRKDDFKVIPKLT